MSVASISIYYHTNGFCCVRLVISTLSSISCFCLLTICTYFDVFILVLL